MSFVSALEVHPALPPHRALAALLEPLWETLAAILPIVLLLIAPSAGRADDTDLRRQRPSVASSNDLATVSRVRLLLKQDSPAMEIISTHPIRPVITRIQDPPALRIDLNNARISVPHKQIPVQSPLIGSIFLDQLAKTPPAVRILVHQRTPLSYNWEAAGNRLTIHFHVESEEVAAKPPSVPALAADTPPVAVPVNPGGTLTFADQMASGSSFSAKFATETLRLSRGGEVRLCPGTSVSIVHPKNGSDLMLAMGVGAMETHYALDNSADTIITPDFRILLRGPGEFHYAIRADSQGNTCVRSLPGNTAPVIVYESIGNGQFEVVPTEKLVLHAGHVDATDTAFHSGEPTQVETIVPDDCGCPAPPPLLLADSATTASSAVLTPHAEDDPQTPGTAPAPTTLSNGPEISPLPKLAAEQKPVKFGASLVFSSKDARPPRLSDLPLSGRPTHSLTNDVEPPPSAPVTHKKNQKSMLRKVGGFFARIFR